jgi:hypothetical protein
VVTPPSRIQLKLKLVIPNSNSTIEKRTHTHTTSKLNLALNRGTRTSSSPLRLEVSIMLRRSIQDHLQAEDLECELNLVRELTLSCYGVNYNINILLHLNKQYVFNDGPGDMRSQNV